MRSEILLAFTLLISVGCELSQTNPKANGNNAAGSTPKESQPLPAPEPFLGIEEFAKILEENFYEDTPSDVESVSVSNDQELVFILDNLAHLRNIKEIIFRDVEFPASVFTRLNNYTNVTEIGLRGYDSFDFERLAKLERLDRLTLSDCSDVSWQLVSDICRNLRQLEISDSPIDAEGFRQLSALKKLDKLVLVYLDQVTDDDLKPLIDSTRLKSFAAYNCSKITGSFLNNPDKLVSLREFRFTGPLDSQSAESLAALPGLQEITIRSKVELQPEWYQAIAKGCTELKSLRLYYQALDKAKIESVAVASELEELAVYNESEFDSMGFGGPRVRTAAGDLASLANLRHLRTLHLSNGYKINDADGAAIASLEKLEQLNLWGSRFESGALSQLGNLSRLKKLDLDSATGLDSSDADGIASLSALESLKLTKVLKAPGADFSCLKRLHNLRELDLVGFLNLDDADMDMAEGMQNLGSLQLGMSVGVTDKGLAKWHQATSLRSLTIRKLSVDGTGFQSWPPDHSIEEIFVHGTTISGEGLRAMSQFQNLVDVYLNVINFAQPIVKVDLSVFSDTPSARSLTVLGSYRTSQTVLDALAAANEELALSCNIEE
jgi:Leucine-rich repeat (LRR) protein